VRGRGIFLAKLKRLMDGWDVVVFGFTISIYEWAYDQLIFLS
jgi:hypothetical protein